MNFITTTCYEIYKWLWVLKCTTVFCKFLCLHVCMFLCLSHVFICFSADCESGNCTSMFCRRYCRQLGRQTGFEVKGGDRGFQERQTFKFGLTLMISLIGSLGDHESNRQSKINDGLLCHRSCDSSL